METLSCSNHNPNKNIGDSHCTYCNIEVEDTIEVIMFSVDEGGLVID